MSKTATLSTFSVETGSTLTERKVNFWFIRPSEELPSGGLTFTIADGHVAQELNVAWDDVLAELGKGLKKVPGY